MSCHAREYGTGGCDSTDLRGSIWIIRNKASVWARCANGPEAKQRRDRVGGRSRRQAYSHPAAPGRPSHAAFLLGLFLSLALAAALVESKSTSAARIRVLIEWHVDRQWPNRKGRRLPTAQEWVLWGRGWASPSLSSKPQVECLWRSRSTGWCYAPRWACTVGGLR
jgi:hypothetical protein